MYAVGRLGSYITRGVYTVSGPFHPFGGAVDIVVVQQPDGSLKSSPWYVRFGKFQGVLKAKERIVDINVNDVDAGFNMYLDPRGEAYFLHEVDSEEVSPSSSGEETDRDRIPAKSKSMNYDFDECNNVIDVGNGQVLSRNNSRRSRILGFVLGRKSMKEHSLSKEESDCAEIAADLLEMKWSTNLSSRTNKNDSKDFKESEESSKDNGETIAGRLESSLVLREQHFVNDLEHNKIIDSVENCVSKEESSRIELDDRNKLNEQEPGSKTSKDSLKIVSESRTEVIEVSNEQGDVSIEVASCSSVSVPVCQTEDKVDLDMKPERFVEEHFVFSDLDMKPSINTTEKISEVGSISPMYYHQERVKVDNIEGMKGKIRKYPSSVDIPRSSGVREEELGRHSKSLPNMWCRFDESDQEIHDDSPFYSPVAKFRSSKWDLVRDDAPRIVKSSLEKEQSGDNLSKELKDGDGPGIGDGTGGSWSLWPFRRLASKNVSLKEEECKKDSDIDNSGLEIDGEKESSSPQSDKNHTRALTPTPEQLASLNLAEGQNTVTFTFSTSVLGSQKVDARIYLWRWDTRIVISDVDGTITKSDVLGQFMPLVGRDWSHIGVTHLFSAIKENGYQMLYLSARAISQASLTRQFLFNLMQDGKALPDGPVVISPDGLFPSLFREVIRRAPHEFKIACLEDIKACFPPDRNPFYAGFGNRDTDEFSYLKVGIAKGKIFIINPKGEVVVNRCIDSKSYMSLHALVNGIFPPISVHEEEDYNSWNFWKLPPPTIE